MFELLAMSIEKSILHVEFIAKKRESNSITMQEITDFLRVDLESK